VNLADKTTDELIALAAGLLESWEAPELKEFSLVHVSDGWTCSLTHHAPAAEAVNKVYFVHCYIATKRETMRRALLDCLEKPARDGLLGKAGQ